jgi:hypothetical protein
MTRRVQTSWLEWRLLKRSNLRRYLAGAGLSAAAANALLLCATIALGADVQQGGTTNPAPLTENLSVKPVKDLFGLVSDLPTKDFLGGISGLFGVSAALVGLGYYFGRQKQEHDHALAKLERDNLKTDLERLQEELHEQNKRVAVKMNAYSGLDASQIEAGTFVREASQLEAFKQKMLGSARHRIWYFGASFHITTSTHRKSLLDRIRSGVDVRVVFSDPEGTVFKANAASFGQTPELLIGEVRVTQANLESMITELGSDADGSLQYRVVDEVFTHGVYMYDLDTEGGGTVILVPHVWGSDAPAVPGIIVEGSMGKSVVNAYRLMFEAKWKKAKRLSTMTVIPPVDAATVAVAASSATDATGQ